MIPIHDFVSKDIQSIRVVKLDALTHYDTTEPHRHNYFEIFIFDKGKGTHDIDFQSFPIDSASLHIVAPGQVHQVKRELDTNGFVILFDFSAIERNTAASDFLYDHLCFDVNELHPIYKFQGDSAADIIRTANTLWQDYNSDNNLREEFLKNHLNLLCISCLRKIHEKKPKSSLPNETYREFRRLLRSNFKVIKKVNEYASALNISEKKLNDIVSSRTGLTCSNLIYKQITLEAKRLLNSELSAKEVAYELNFEDPSHFSKFFKSQTGSSPSEYQNIQG
ncbi:AraC family transcriptional regulator [Halocola ammonii]